MDAGKRRLRQNPPGGRSCPTQPEASVSVTAGPPCLTTVHRSPGTDKTVVVVRGEVDHGCEDALERSLTDALSCSAHGIEIDLSKVSFWACSSVKVLLAVRQLAGRQSKTVSLRAISPIVRRVLDLTGTLRFFTTDTAPASPPAPGQWPAVIYYVKRGQALE
ncbi:STAS domain-containing protein [Streptomyces sp. NPDC047108]|uniref:STAS domain-containing protein n=1 Tax=Streptomyces sp. NPDC047108 TaxID=3155025 RepID=UPI003405F4CE